MDSETHIGSREVTADVMNDTNSALILKVDNNDDRNVVQPAVCRFFKNGNSCKHGKSGKKDGTCKCAHPKVCNISLRKRKCSVTNCKYWHPPICYNALNPNLDGSFWSDLWMGGGQKPSTAFNCLTTTLRSV